MDKAKEHGQHMQQQKGTPSLPPFRLCQLANWRKLPDKKRQVATP